MDPRPRSAQPAQRNKKIQHKTSTVPKEDPPCVICDRPKGTVKCRKCNYETHGRLAVHCENHPKVIFQSDHAVCPNPKCKDPGSLFEKLSISEKIVNTFKDCDCICNRPPVMLLCENCGFTTDGRWKRVCPSHPRTFFVHDLPKCPVCKNMEGLEELN